MSRREAGGIGPNVAETAASKVGSIANMLRPGAGAPATVVNQAVVFNVNAIDSRDMTRALQEQKGTIAQVVAEAARDSSGYRRALAGA